MLFRIVINIDVIKDLGRMYMLCERVEGGLDELRKALEEHIRKQGLNALEKVKDQAHNVSSFTH